MRRNGLFAQEQVCGYDRMRSLWIMFWIVLFCSIFCASLRAQTPTTFYIESHTNTGAITSGDLFQQSGPWYGSGSSAKSQALAPGLPGGVLQGSGSEWSSASSLDASFTMRIGNHPSFVPGTAYNISITTPKFDTVDAASSVFVVFDADHPATAPLALGIVPLTKAATGDVWRSVVQNVILGPGAAIRISEGTPQGNRFYCDSIQAAPYSSGPTPTPSPSPTPWPTPEAFNQTPNIIVDDTSAEGFGANSGFALDPTVRNPPRYEWYNITSSGYGGDHWYRENRRAGTSASDANATAVWTFQDTPRAQYTVAYSISSSSDGYDNCYYSIKCPATGINKMVAVSQNSAASEWCVLDKNVELEKTVTITLYNIGYGAQTLGSVLFADAIGLYSAEYPTPTPLYGPLLPGDLTYVKAIDISSHASFAGGIDSYDDALFVGSINNNLLLKITDPTGPSPVVSVFADFSTRTAWVSGRGILGIQIDQATGRIYVAGDTGAANQGYCAVLDQSGVFLDEEKAIPERMYAIAPYAHGSAEVVGSYRSSSTLRTYALNGPNAISEVSVSNSFSPPYDAHIRDIVVDGTKIYYVRNGTSGVDACAVLDNTASPGDLTGLTSTGVYQTTALHSMALEGIGLLKWGAATYILFPDRGIPAVQFIDAANPGVAALSVMEPSMTTGIWDVCCMQIGGQWYMFVTESASASPTNDKIRVFRIENANRTPAPSPTPSPTFSPSPTGPALSPSPSPTASPSPVISLTPTPVWEPNILTVAKSVPAQYSTFAAALAAASDGNVIRILDSNTYSESLPEIKLLNLTIEASPGQSPTLENTGPSPGIYSAGGLFYSPPQEGTLTIRGSSPVRKMTVRHQSKVIGNRGDSLSAVKANLNLENLILEISPGSQGMFLEMSDWGNHQIRNVELRGLGGGPRINFACAGGAVFEDCDLRSQGHDFIVAFQNHTSGTSGTLVLRRCILAPYQDGNESPGVAGVRSSTGTGRLVLEDCQISSGGGESYHAFLICNEPARVEIIQPVILGGLGGSAFNMRSPLGGSLTIMGRTPWNKVLLDPMWDAGSTGFVETSCGDIRLQDIRSTRQGPTPVRAVTSTLWTSMASPCTIEMERCEWLGGTGVMLLGPVSSYEFTYPIRFSARNTIWAGARTQVDVNVNNLIQLGGISPFPASRPVSRIDLTHCTLQGPGFKRLIYADQRYGDVVEAHNTIFDDTGTYLASSSSSPPLTGSGNLVAHKGSLVPSWNLSFPNGEPADTLAADPFLDSRGHLTLQSPALAALQCPSPSLLDVDGDSRPQPPQSGRFDIGADECNETGQTGRIPAVLRLGEQVQTSIAPIQFYDAMISVPPDLQGAGLAARLRLLEDSAGWTLLGQKNALPALETAMWKAMEKTKRGTIEILIPSPEPGDYYFSAYHVIPPFEQPRPFLLDVISPSHYVSQVNPESLGLGYSRDFWIQGLGLDGARKAELRDPYTNIPARIPLEPQAATWWGSSVDLRSAAEGDKDLIIQFEDEETSLPSAMTLQAGPQERFEAYVVVPQTIRKDRLYTAYVHYANMGVSPIRSPMLTLVSMDQVEFLESCARKSAPRAISLYAVSPDWPPDILAPGASNVQPIQFRCTGGEPHQQINFGIRIQKPSRKSIQWSPPTPRPLGANWDEYLAHLGAEARRFWLAGRKNPCLSDLYYQLAQRAAGFPEYFVAGQLVSSETGSALPRVKMILRENKDSADVTEYCWTETPDGRFLFPSVPAGEYELFAPGYALEYDWPIRMNDADHLNLNVIAHVVPPPEPEPQPAPPSASGKGAAPSIAAQKPAQESPSMLEGEDGKSYLAWLEKGCAKVAVLDAGSWRVVVEDGECLTTATELTAAWAPNLGAYSSGPGLVLVRASGDDKHSCLHYSLAKWETDGGLMSLSSWQALTSDAYADRGPCAVALPDGRALTLWLQRDESIQDDTDLYSALITYALSQTSSPKRMPAGLLPSISSPDLFLSSPELAHDRQITFRYDFSKGQFIPNWLPFLNGEYKYEIRGDITGVDSDCGIRVRGAIGAKVKVSDILDLISNINGSATWKWDCKKEEMLFDNAKFGGRIQGESKCPFSTAWPPPFTPIGGIVLWLNSIGIESGLLIRITASGNLEYRESPLVRPYQGSFVELRMDLGPYMCEKKKLKGNLWEVQFDVVGFGSYKITFQRYDWIFEMPAAGVIIRIKTKIGKFTLQYEAVCKTPGSSETHTNKLGPGGIAYPMKNITMQEDGPSFEFNESYTFEPLIGTSNIYEGSMVVPETQSNLEMEGRASVARSVSGEILAAWTHESPAQSPLLGTELLVASWNGNGFDVPIPVHGAADSNADPSLVFDSGGTPWVAYTSASCKKYTLQSEPKAVFNAMQATDIYYSRRVGGVWSSPAPLAEQSGRETSVQLAAGPDGRMLAIWVHQRENDDAVLAAQWNAGVWDPPTTLTTALKVHQALIVYHGIDPLAVWLQDGDGNYDTPDDSRLQTSRLLNGSWSAPAPFDPAPLPSPAAPISNTQKLAQLADELSSALSKPAPSNPTPTPNSPMLFHGDSQAICCTETPSPTPPPAPTPEPVSNDYCTTCGMLDLCCPDCEIFNEDSSGDEDDDKGGACGGGDETELILPHDPNEKVGPLGIGSSHRIPSGNILDYIIYFENATTATAAAQEIVITDVLDPSLDFTSLQFLEVGIGSTMIAPSAPGLSLHERRDWPDWLGRVYAWWGDFEASLDPETRTLTWRLRILDPVTGEIPEDVFAGILPPNDAAGRGQGYVRFRIQSRSDIVQGAIVYNQAQIDFDTEDPILTFPIFNTIEDGALESPSNPNPPDQGMDISMNTAITWTGSEEAVSYDVFLWKSGEPAPDYPVGANLLLPYFQPPGTLQEDMLYFWQAHARNAFHEASGPIWQFTTQKKIQMQRVLWMLF